MRSVLPATVPPATGEPALPLTQRDRPVLYLHTPERLKAELTWVVNLDRYLSVDSYQSKCYTVFHKNNSFFFL